MTDKTASATWESVVLVSAMRSDNIGDIAMLEAAATDLRSRVAGNVYLTAVGPPSGSTVNHVDDTLPISESLLPGLRRLKSIWAAYFSPKKSPSRNQTNGWLRWCSNFAARMVIIPYIIAFVVIVSLRWFLRIPLPAKQARFCDALRNASTVVTSGGGWINSLFPLTMYEQFFVLWASGRMLNKPVYLLGEQIGPLNNALDQMVASAVFRQCHVIGVRDPESLAVAEAFRSTAGRTVLFGDWAYTANDVTGTLGQVRKIGVHVRDSHYSPMGNDCYEAIATALQRHAKTHEVEIHLIPTCIGAHESDLVAFRRLTELLGEPLNVTVHKPFQSSRACVDAIGSMDLNIGVSYHFCLFSLMNAKPVIGIALSEYYVQKLTGLLSLFRQRESVVPTAELRAEVLTEYLSRMQCGAPELTSALQSANEALTEQFAETRRTITSEIRTQVRPATSTEILPSVHGVPDDASSC